MSTKSRPSWLTKLAAGIIMQSVLTLFGFWLANVVMNWGVAFFGYQGLTGPATLPLIIALSVFGIVTMPLPTPDNNQ